MTAFGRAVLAATHNPVARSIFTRTGPGRALADRFVAGDTLDQAVSAVGGLNAGGMAVSLDLLGEEVRDEQTALEARDAYLACLDRIGVDRLDANISVKLTQLGLAFDRRLARSSVERLARRAGELGTTVTIDMEDSRFTADTIDIYAEAQAAQGNLGVCLQAALHRTPEDLERIAPLGGHIRLCKGAYVEPAAVAHQSKDEVDAAFVRLLESLMGDDRIRPAIATHDDRMLSRAEELGRTRSAPYEFQMLYGVRGDRQRSLVDAGHDLRIYVPYGSEWYAYLTRRLAERPANMMFFLRALAGKS